MSENKKLVPKRRFKEFQNTDAWEQLELGEVAENFEYGLNAAAIDYDGINKYLRITDIDDSSREFDKSSLTSPKINLDKAGNYLLKEGDLLFARTGASVGKTYQYRESDGKIYYAGFLIRARILSNFDSIFIFQNTLTKRYKNFVSITSQRSGQPGINAQEYASFEFFAPKIKEQEKIGEFFATLDQTIAFQQRKLEKMKSMKSAYLSEMFPAEGERKPKRRFPGFTDDWEPRELGKTNTFFTDGNYGESYPKESDMSDSISGVPFLRGSDFKDGYLDSSEANFITKEKHSKLTSGHIQTDDIVLAVRGSLGTLGYATEANQGWNINSQLAIIRTDKQELLGSFLVQFLLSGKGQNELLSRNTGSALKQLPIKQLKDIPVPITSIEEQLKIGQFFTNLDQTIAFQQQKLEKLQNIKKAYLNEMFI